MAVPSKILLVCCLLFSAAGIAQPLRFSSLYPSAGKIDEAITSKYTFLTTGSAEGDCQNGTGTYVTVSFSQQGSYQDKLYGQLIYTLYKGVFNSADSSFNGQVLEQSLRVTMKKGKSSYSPDGPKPDFNRAKLIANGQFKKKVFEKNNLAQEGYIRHGWVQKLSWNPVKYYDSYQSFSGYYMDGRLCYARIIYPDNYTLDMKSFTGIVTGKGKPVLGIQVMRNGQAVKFGLYSKGVPELAANVYDTSLLLALVKQKEGRQSIQLTIPDDAGSFFLADKDNAQLKTCSIGGGSIIHSGGLFTGSGFTGQGVFYSPDGKLYAGGFNNGQPNGEGFLFIDEDSKDPVLKKYEHKLLGTFSNGQVTDALYGATDSGTEPNFRRLASQATINQAWAALQQKAEKGDVAAMFEFARKYYGNSAPEPNPARALEWLEKSANYGYIPAVTELVAIYSGEKAYHRHKDVFPANAERRAYWAGVVCQMDKQLAVKQDNLLEPTYYQIYFGYYYNYLNHWEKAGKIGSNQPFLSLQQLHPEKENFLKWVNDDIKRESAAGKYYSVRVSNYSLQPLLLNNDPGLKFNVVAYHFGKLPASLEFSISRFNVSMDTINNQKVTNRSRNSLVCTFDKDDLRYTGKHNKRTCTNGSLAAVFKNSGMVEDYFFNLTPVNNPEMKVDCDWNKKGFFRPVDAGCNVIWVVYFYK